MQLFFLQRKAAIATAITIAMGLNSIQAQNGARNPVSTITPVAPTTASLLKYVDFNVNSNTGVPDITIPLFEIKGKQLSLPLSISYNASGIKVSEQAGNIGLSWSLSAAGLISCSIRSKPDDGSYWPDVPNTLSDGFDPMTSQGDFNIAKQIGTANKDGAPDLYSYNFGSYSGKFLDIINKTPTITMIPKKPLLIEKYTTSPTQTIPFFKITAEDGTQYFFEAMENSFIRTSYTADKSSNTWHLTKILSANGSDQIVFNYEDTYYEDLPGVGESFTFIKNACNFGTEVRTGSAPDKFNYSSSRILGKQLKSIVFSEGRVDFDVSYDRLDVFGDLTKVRNPKVNRIILKNNVGDEIKTVTFNYSYYNPTAPATDIYSKRLRLDRVDICPQSSLCGVQQYTNSYKFTYNSATLPKLNSYAQDHWGYYNGINTNNTLIPSYPFYLTPNTCYSTNPFCGCTPPPRTNTFTGADRRSSPDFVKTGMLEKIEYPTGGNVQFNYETNQGAPVVYTTAQGTSVSNQVTSTLTNGTFTTIDTDTARFVPFDSKVGTGVCAVISIGYGHPGVTDQSSLDRWKPHVDLYKCSTGGDCTVMQTIYLPSNSQPTTVNVTLPPGFVYKLRLYTQLKNSVITGTLTYSIPVNHTDPYYVGGLRLKQKTVYDPVANNSMVTNYSYTNATFNQPTAYEQTSFAYEQVALNTCGETCISSQFMYDKKEYTTLIANYGGIDNDVFYTEITSSYGVSGENGKTVTHYSPANNIFFWRRGSIDDQQEFNASGKLLKKIVNHYAGGPGSENIQGLEVSAVYEHPCLALQPQNFSTYSKYVSFKPVANISEWYYMDTTTTYNYDTQTANVMRNQTIYQYQNPLHMQVTGVLSATSQGFRTFKSTTYPQDYVYSGTLTGSASVMKEMINRHIIASPIEELTQQEKATKFDVSFYTSSATINTYKLSNNQIAKDVQYRLKTTNPISDLSDFVRSKVVNGQFTYDSRYEPENQFTLYDINQNLVELKQRDNYYAFRCPVNGDIWAKTTHATYNETAYSSFEHKNIPNDFTNWNYNNANIVAVLDYAPIGNMFNGTQAYRFASGGDLITNRIALAPTQKFKISFWGKAATINVVALFNPAVVNSSVTVPLRQGPTRLGWTYYEGYFTNADHVQLTGTGVIDELRLYPQNARMTTYVYKNGVGIMSTCNENNQNTYWDYDEFNRLKRTNDQDGFILNRTEYNYLKVQN